MRLMNDPHAMPTAYHSPIPMPLHWQDEVKAGLDRDVRLNVLEPVPIREPVTWCHRMVICAKKNGLQRTINFNPSASMLPGKHTTLTHFSTKQDQSHKGKKILSSMHGTATIASHPY